MSNIRLTTVPCPLCRSDESLELFSVRDYTLHISDQRFILRKCCDCGVGYLSPRPREEDIGAFYPEEFYWLHEGAEQQLSGNALLAVRRRQLEAKADCLAHLPPGNLLDIGAQKGDFVYWMEQKGWRCEGVEYSDKPPNLYNMPIHYGEFLNMEWCGKAFDCITMWAVLEHVYSPGRYIDKVAEIMTPGGKFIGLVTNLDSLQARYLKMDDYPRHLTIFTRNALERALAASGFRLDRCWTDQKIFGGSMRGAITYFSKRLFGYSDDEVLSEWKNPVETEAFCCRWHGQPSWLMKQVSRLDHMAMAIPDSLSDRMGKGFLLSWEATYVGKGHV